jgi:hypothetical protein
MRGLFAAMAAVAAAITYLILTIASGKYNMGWTLFRRPFFCRKIASRPNPVIIQSPAQIAYRNDRNATAACIHLQPIEHAMRIAGVDVRLLEQSQYQPIVMADCRINEAELQRVFTLPASVQYWERYQPERSEWDKGGCQ